MTDPTADPNTDPNGDPNAGPTPDPAGGATCRNCGAPRAAGTPFCEVCGLDHATGELPLTPSATPAPAVATGWALEIEADRAYFDSNQAESPDVTVTFPAGAVTRTIDLVGDEVHVGRRSASTGVHPDIDLTDDPGVSRRHAILRRDADDTWVVVDLGSTNGTRVRGGNDPIAADQEVALAEGDTVHVGAWSRLTLRRATA